MSFEKQFGRFRVVWFRRTQGFGFWRNRKVKGGTWFFYIGKLRIWRDGRPRG